MEESEDKIMKSFPFDSQVTYDPQGNPTYDRGVNSADLADNISLLYTNGVLPNPSTCLQVTESENQMSVLVNPGACCINGRLGKEEVVRTIVFEASSSLYDRIDRVVLRLNTNIDVRAIDIYVVKGTPSASPVAPDLTRTGGIYELCLADVFIAKNTTYISVSRITDTRFESELCGLMMNKPQSLDTTTLFEQYQSALNEFLDFANSCISETVAGQLEESFAELYSNSKSYAVGEFCSHNGLFFVCKTSTSGTWKPEHWIRTNVNVQLLKKINYSDIVDNGETADSNKPLSANYGKALKDYVDGINGQVGTNSGNITSLQTAVGTNTSNISALQNKINLNSYSDWDIPADTEDYFFGALGNYIMAWLQIGQSAFFSGSWAGHFYMGGFATRTGESSYFGFVNFKNGRVYAFDETERGAL